MLSGGDIEAYRQAFEQARAGDWPRAHASAATAREPLLAAVVRWLELRDPRRKIGFGALLSFLADKPGWPRPAALRRRAERVMPRTLEAGRVIEFFDDGPPLTAEGTLRHLEALAAAGRDGEARDAVRRAWRERDFTAAEESAFRRRHGGSITPDIAWSRADRLIWEGKASAARRVLALLDGDRRALARARMRLRGDGGGIDGAMAGVPRALRRDPGLLYERVRRRRRHGDLAGAGELLAMAPSRLPRPGLWARERLLLARELLARGDAPRAHRLLADRRAPSDVRDPDLEWLAGWTALRRLARPRVALGHFVAFRARVSFPVSRARGAYWAARASACLGDAPGAAARYEVAAADAHTFYGQLAAAELGVAPRLPEPPVPDGAEIEDFEGSESVAILRGLAQLGEQALVGAFLTRMAAAASSPTRHVLLARLARAVGRPDLAVKVARKAVESGAVLAREGHPSIALPAEEHASRRQLDPALVLAVIRQESGFDPRAVSVSGARGLMQLMPATALEVASELGVSTSRQRLTADPEHNVRLGRAYLARMIRDQEGSLPRALAAYNAGPHRVRRWLEAFGDPLDPATDAIDWIESIPFAETRNYVQRVLESRAVYGMALGVEVPRWDVAAPG